MSSKNHHQEQATMQRFPPITAYDSSRKTHKTVASDLDGTLLASSSAFPYYFLVAFEAGGYFRALILLMTSPLILFLYLFVSESAAIKLLIFLTFSGQRYKNVEAVSRTVLPRFYAADVRRESWEAFWRCDQRRVVVTASPSVMVGWFVKEYLKAEVVGTEVEVERRTGRCTGRVVKGEVLVGRRKKEVVERVFGEELPDLGLGDRSTDHDFMALCKEAYMIPKDPNPALLPPEKLATRTIFHDGRLVRRPEPSTAMSTLLYLPFGFLLAIFRVFFNLLIPVRHVRRTYALSGIDLSIRGTPPPPPSPGSPGSLLVCNHRTALDPIIVSIALGRQVHCVTYSVSKLSTAISPIPAVALTRDRNADAAKIAELLKKGDVVVCPEGTTCREPFLLRFSALFAELSDRIVPVSVVAKQDMFYASTVRGFKFLDPYFFYMNPRPGYDVTFSPMLKPDETCGAGGRPAIDVANDVQNRIADVLGFECTMLTRKDKYMHLAGSDGIVVTEKNKEKKVN